MAMVEVLRALPPHSTPTSGGGWDGPRAKANLKNDETAAYYRKAFAWVDEDGDPDVKSSYKFIHHEVAADGEIGSANMIACRTGMAVLNGARGGTVIPDADRKGVWNHLSRHMMDADMEPPELKSKYSAARPERFTAAFTIKETTAAENGQVTLKGYAAVFDQLSDLYFGYRVRIKKGAFKKALSGEPDIRALWNHNYDMVMGRTKSGTLTLKEDKKGLYVEIHPPMSMMMAGCIESMQRGDVDQMSFGFAVEKEEWIEEDGESIREIKLFGEVYEVSPVTFPAFPQTEVKIASRCLGCPSRQNELQLPEDITEGIELITIGLIESQTSNSDSQTTVINITNSDDTLSSQPEPKNSNIIDFSLLQRRLELERQRI